ncbi:glycosyltransferase [Paenibacillus glufosinatiresistens]|uniref:glycosyltransferase n=1 Tax=Paenibacillus glufosinatiresistens TaxID=3070657 RepID=UPI00286DC09D|nr:glycosyltransferase family A protein [Paenibacillus sp. YX.27]
MKRTGSAAVWPRFSPAARRRRPEILVLDDGSEDGTAEAARRAGGPAVTVLAGRPLPEGWAGKPHACAQLAEAARGKWLLFLDADVRLAPDALAAAMATGEAAGGGLVTGFPRQETGTWLERLVVPLMLFTVVCHLPVPLVRGSADPRFVAAHGGFMLIRRDAYDACGGHRAVASALVDDMALARAVKSAGMPVTLANLSDHVRMRMYENAGEVWRGYRKNLYDGLGRRPLLLLGVMAVYLTGYVLPPAVLLGAGFAGDPGPAAWACACMLLGAAIKRVADAAGRKSGGYALLLPAGMLALAFIAAASWRGAGRGYWWKGRRYL